MKIKQAVMFKVGLIAFSLTLFLMATGGALGVVWMRQKISNSAEQTLSLERQIVSLERKTGSLRARIAQVHSPDYLKSRVSSQLSQPRQKQVVWMESTAPARYESLAKNQQNLRTLAMNFN